MQLMRATELAELFQFELFGFFDLPARTVVLVAALNTFQCQVFAHLSFFSGKTFCHSPG